VPVDGDVADALVVVAMGRAEPVDREELDAVPDAGLVVGSSALVDTSPGLWAADRLGAPPLRSASTTVTAKSAPTAGTATITARRGRPIERHRPGRCASGSRVRRGTTVSFPSRAGALRPRAQCSTGLII
jgi:hypothetical protein